MIQVSSFLYGPFAVGISKWNYKPGLNFRDFSKSADYLCPYRGPADGKTGIPLFTFLTDMLDGTPNECYSALMTCLSKLFVFM